MKFFCRKYFCTTEEIYNTFSKNDFQKEALRHCIFHLTETLTAILQNSRLKKLFRCPVVSNAYILLNTFREKLYEQTCSEKLKN